MIQAPKKLLLPVAFFIFFQGSLDGGQERHLTIHPFFSRKAFESQVLDRRQSPGTVDLGIPYSTIYMFAVTIFA